MRSQLCPSLLVVATLSACSVAPPVATSQPAPTFALDVTAAVNALAAKPNRLWQDSSMTAPRVRAALKARAAKGYALEAAGLTWSNNLGAPSSSAPAYAKVDYQNTQGPNPQPGDYLYVVTDNGQVQRLDPATQAKTSANLGTAFSKSAVVVSGDNRRLYLAASNGTFYVLDAVTLATIWSGKISNAGFAGMSPFIDYSNGGGFPLGSDEHVIMLAADGSLYDVHVVRGGGGAYTTTVAAWTASNGTDQAASLPAWTTKVNVPYGAGVTPGSTPVIWNNQAYFGTTSGLFYRVGFNEAAPTSVPTLKSWNLAPYTSAPGPTGKACSAPPALDYDDNLVVTAIFAPCGDRVCWINPATNKVCDSASLMIDKKPTLASQYNGTLSSFSPTPPPPAPSPWPTGRAWRPPTRPRPAAGAMAAPPRPWARPSRAPRSSSRWPPATCGWASRPAPAWCRPCPRSAPWWATTAPTATTSARSPSTTPATASPRTTTAPAAATAAS